MFARETLTLDFEGTDIRLLTTRGEVVTQWHSITVADHIMSQGFIHQPQELGSLLAENLAEMAVAKKRVVSAVSGQRSIYRIMSLPDLDKKLLNSAVERKIRQEIPLQPQETDLSWKVVGKKDGELDIYLVAIPRDIIDRQVQSLQAAGIQLRAMDVKPLALVRTANAPECLIVNLEDHGLSVVIVIDGLPAIVRTVPLGIQQHTSEGRLDLLYQELARTTKFYNESHKDRPLSPDTTAYISGSHFEQPEVRERFAGMSPYPVEVPVPPLAYPDNFPVAEYGVNVGLALKRL